MDNSEKSVIVQSVNSIDQIEHQTIMTEDGRLIDLDQKHFDIIDEDGHIVFDSDGEIIASMAKEQLNYGAFIRTYSESSKKAILMLLALQSNAAPLKRGGIDIAYMTDILVLLVLVIIIGAFIAKGVELGEALLALLKWLAIPILIVAVIWVLSNLGPWLMGTT